MVSTEMITRGTPKVRDLFEVLLADKSWFN